MMSVLNLGDVLELINHTLIVGIVPNREIVDFEENANEKNTNENDGNDYPRLRLG